ncbi:hypothetical protein [Pseudomonas sp. B1(2018)]|uniref:hypothetical protein n=1 Tax=Pseudomonas sp. B1(2018) TaxID=2233856 RepID=UPI00140252F0|nr:hypothetical protein [Pseudomonas sp. B1(2018)]
MRTYLFNSTVVHSGIGTSLLSNNKLLKKLMHIPFTSPLPAEDIEEAAYLTFQTWLARQPDHVFQSNWRLFCTAFQAKTGHWVAPALNSLANDFLIFRHGRLHVSMERFGDWQQSLLSRVSALPILAAAYAKNPFNSSGESQLAKASGPHATQLLSPIHPLVEDYIEREGLHETHLHLNGSTHAEACWLKALHEPKSEIMAFSKQYSEFSPNGARTRELCHSINEELSPSILHRQLLGARNIRAWLILLAYESDRALHHPIPPVFECMADYKEVLSAPTLMHTRALIDQRCSYAQETSWIRIILQRLQHKPEPLVDRLLHIYLLLQNQYYRLLVQGEDQYGFDQFQKLTFTNLRDPLEKHYLARFQQMHGERSNVSRVGWLEGRFAPKKTMLANQAILTSVLGGYLEYLQQSKHSTASITSYTSLSKILDSLEAFQTDLQSPSYRKNHKLTLVAHFPKKPWNWQSKKEKSYRHYSLRKDLVTQGNALLSVVNRWPLLKGWVTGIDAAANELHAPPEIFAPVFRVCNQHGFSHRTYHVGEDFPHLISGLRHVIDALQLLDLKEGDRIGHGTAFGIAPALWLARMPPTIVVARGEWMLDLLYAWTLLRSHPSTQLDVRRIETSIAEMAGYIFNQEISTTCLENVMRLRGLHIPYVLMADRDPTWNWQQTSLSDAWREEARIVDKEKRANGRLFKLFTQWVTGEGGLWSRSEELISIDADYLDKNTLLLLQQNVMQLLVQRNVVVETLPTSNVRISQYETYSEHHSLRWMKAPGFAVEGDPDIMISLGSDDPGVFANDLNGDFYQLYAVLQKAGILDTQALQLLSSVNERGRQYRFHKRAY